MVPRAPSRTVVNIPNRAWNLSTARHVLAARGPAFRHVTRRPKADSVNDSETPAAACEAILRRLDDYIDRELSPSDMQMVEQHIEECRHCAGVYRFEMSLIQAVRSRLRRICLPGDLMARIRLQLDADAAG
jgi:anti-sigma factor (TIGR02949 family)